MLIAYNFIKPVKYNNWFFEQIVFTHSLKLHLFFSLLLYFLPLTLLSQNTSLEIKLPVHYEQHIFNVDYGPPNTKGKFADANLGYGLEVLFTRTLNKNLIGSIGVAYNHAQSNIKRVYNRRYWNDYTAILNYTNDVGYKLARVPIGLKYNLVDNGKLNVTLGTSVNINYTFLQSYKFENLKPDKLSRFYFFGFSNDINIGIKKMVGKRNSIEVQPFLRVYEKWRKDAVLFEDQRLYHSLTFNTVGLALSYSFNFQ